MQRFIFYILIFISLSGVTQGLKPGDKCPELLFDKIINSDVHSETLSGLKGKLVLLDFGATTCMPCLHLLPTLDSLQKKFNGRFKVFMITKEKKEKVVDFLRGKNGQKTKISFIAEDSLLNALFPHKALPHEVWIGPDGTIAAITVHEYVTVDNIETILKGNKINWPVKSDFEYDHSVSLVEYAKNTSLPKVYSTATVYAEGFNSKRTKIVNEDSSYTMRYINYSLMDLYFSLYRRSPHSFYPAQVKIDSSIINRFIYNGVGFFEEWKRSNSYCYELHADNGLNDAVGFEKMRDDLDFYFGFSSSLEKKKMKCWVITKTEHVVSESGGTNLWSVISKLNLSGNYQLVINDTGLSDEELMKIYFKFDKAALPAKESLIALFQSYGFIVSEADREIEVLSIETKNKL